MKAHTGPFRPWQIPEDGVDILRNARCLLGRRRGLTDYWAFSTVKHLGAGQFYLMSIRDKTGQPLDGSKTYRLTVPANAPAKQYWSAVVYDRATHALIRNATRLSRSSQTLIFKRTRTDQWMFISAQCSGGKTDELDTHEPGWKV